MAARQIIRLNGFDYVLTPNARGNSGVPINRLPIPEYGDPLKTVGGQTQSDLDRTQAIYHSLVDGFGMKTVPSNWDGYPFAPRKFFDSTADTRWSGGTWPGILNEDSTETGLEVIRGSVLFKNNYWSIWEDDSSDDVVARKYDADAGVDDHWTAGGTVVNKGAGGASFVNGQDLIASGDTLVCLTVHANDHEAYISTDGVTWNASTTQITADLLGGGSAGQNGDAIEGLLAVIGGETVAVIHDNVASTITFFSSTDKGDNWTNEGIDLPVDDGPRGLAVMAGIDNADKLYVGTPNGLWEVDTVPATWTFRLIDPMPFNDGNCQRMVVHGGTLWYSVGVDNNSPAPIHRLVNQDGTRVIETFWGLDVGDGIPADMLGPIRWMASSGGFLYASVGGGAASRNARVICHTQAVADDGVGGWHSVFRHGTPNQKIEWIGLASNDDAVPRLHFAIRTGSGTSDTKFLAYPNTNPASVSALIKRVAAGSFVDLPFVDLGMPTYDGTWLQSRVAAADLGATSAEYINLDYGVNDVAYGSFTNLGDIVAGTQFLDWASGAGIQGFNSSHRINLIGDAADTDAVVFKSLEVLASKFIPVREAWEFTVDIRATARRQGAGASEDTIITRLEAARDLKTLPIFSYGRSGNKYVKVRPVLWRESLHVPGGGRSAGAPNQLSHRARYAEIRIEEQV